MKFEVHSFHRDVCTDPSLMNGCAAGDQREEAGGSLFCSKSQAFWIWKKETKRNQTNIHLVLCTLESLRINTDKPSPPPTLSPPPTQPPLFHTHLLLPQLDNPKLQTHSRTDVDDNCWGLPWSYCTDTSNTEQKTKTRQTYHSTMTVKINMSK